MKGNFFLNGTVYIYITDPYSPSVGVNYENPYGKYGVWPNNENNIPLRISQSDTGIATHHATPTVDHCLLQPEFLRVMAVI